MRQLADLSADELRELTNDLPEEEMRQLEDLIHEQVIGPLLTVVERGIQENGIITDDAQKAAEELESLLGIWTEDESQKAFGNMFRDPRHWTEDEIQKFVDVPPTRRNWKEYAENNFGSDRTPRAVRDKYTWLASGLSRLNDQQRKAIQDSTLEKLREIKEINKINEMSPQKLRVPKDVFFYFKFIQLREA